MKNIIVYATKTGFVTECVEKLTPLLKGETVKINLAGKPPRLDFSTYDRVIIGGSIHAGRLQKSVQKFCAQNAAGLAGKKTALFLACLAPPPEAIKYFRDNFPQNLGERAIAKGIFGAAVYYERMNPLERFILKKITKKDESFSAQNEKGIEAFAAAVNQA